jgi:hypothetical protein
VTDVLGAGIGFRRPHRDGLLRARAEDRPRPDVLEVIPGHFFASPAAIEPLAAAYPLVFHEVCLSLGTAGANDLDRKLVQRVRELVELARPRLVSDHLALTRSPSGTDVGHLCPMPYSEESLALVCDRVRALQDVLRVPVALENIATPFVLGGADMSEPEFFTRLVEKTGCGLLLDLTNLALNAKNHGYDAFDRLGEYPLASVWQVHVAGGVREGEWWVDTHSEPVDVASLELLVALRGRAPLRAIVVERDDKLPDLDTLVDEAKSAWRAWRDA